MFTEDFLDIVVNVQWGGGLYALVWVYAGPTSYEYTGGGPATLRNSNGDSIPFNPTVSGAEVIYRRVFINTDFPVVTHSCEYPPAGTAILSNTSLGLVPSSIQTLNVIRMSDPAEYQNFTVPIPLPSIHSDYFGAPFPGGCSGAVIDPPNGTTQHILFSGEYRDGPDIADPASTWPGYQVLQIQPYRPFSVDNVKADFEAVFLLKLPAQKEPSTKTAFTIKTGQYDAGVAVMIYPQKGISVDPTNTKGGGTFFGRARGGRVFVPLKWSTGKPPNGPDGVVWPGYRTLYPGNTPLNDVGNANQWVFESVIEFADFHVPPQTLNVVLTYNDHLTSRPDPGDPMVANKIVQAYAGPGSTVPGDVGGYGFYVDNYCDVPYGTVFDGSSFSYRPTPGPWARIDTDVPLT